MEPTQPQIQTTFPVPSEERSNLLHRFLKIFAFPIAAVSGFWATHTSVRSSAFKTAEDLKIFRKIDGDYLRERKAHIDAHDRGQISMAELHKRDTILKREHRGKIRTRMGEIGRSNFVTQWDYISRSSRQRAIIDGMTVVGVSIGAMLTIGDSKWLTDQLFHRGDDKEKSEKGR
jgi:hypothetical protein